MQNPRAAIQVRAQRTQLTFSPTIPTNQTFAGPPVTPFDTYHRIIKLPIPNLPDDTTIMSPRWSYKSLITQFRTTLAPWQRPLFGPIKQMQPTYSLREVSRTNLPILLVSNASVQKNKQSSFAWILSHDTTTLWKGVGLAPGTTEDIYSGRAEAFGLLAGLLFIQHYIESYDSSQFTDSPYTASATMQELSQMSMTSWPLHEPARMTLQTMTETYTWRFMTLSLGVDPFELNSSM